MILSVADNSNFFFIFCSVRKFLNRRYWIVEDDVGVGVGVEYRYVCNGTVAVLHSFHFPNSALSTRCRHRFVKYLFNICDFIPEDDGTLLMYFPCTAFASRIKEEKGERRQSAESEKHTKRIRIIL